MHLPTLPRRIPPLAYDIALGLLFVAIGQVELHVHSDDGFQAGSVALNTPLQLLVTAPLVCRRLYPRATLLAILGAIVVPSFFVQHSFFFWGGTLPLAITTYTVARYSDGFFGRWCWAVVEAGLFVLALLLPHMLYLSNLFFSLVVFGGVWLIGRVVRRLATQGSELAAALAQLAVEQASREEAAVQAERSRIAVEMHDVVAHAVSLMVVQVGAARMALEQHGSPQTQLRAAEETGREALTELRRTLGVLRERPDSAGLQPLPELSNLPALVERFGSSGLQARLASDVPPDLPASLQLTAYRIVQESLTNALKHAGPVAVDVDITCASGQLIVMVTNAAGPRRATTAGGNGLAGMRERTAMFGGSLTAGVNADGYRVRALLPVPVGTAARVPA